MRAQKIVLLMGGTLSKTEINGFQHTFIVLSPAHLLRQRGPKCCFFANQITLLRDSRCSRVNAWHCWVLVGFGFNQFNNAPRGFRQVLQKPWGSPEERFQHSFTQFYEGSMRTVCEVHRARSAPIAPSRPGPRQLRLVLLDTVVRPHPRYSCNMQPEDPILKKINIDFWSQSQLNLKKNQSTDCFFNI